MSAYKLPVKRKKQIKLKVSNIKEMMSNDLRSIERSILLDKQIAKNKKTNDTYVTLNKVYKKSTGKNKSVITYLKQLIEENYLKLNKSKLLKELFAGKIENKVFKFTGTKIAEMSALDKTNYSEIAQRMLEKHLIIEKNHMGSIVWDKANVEKLCQIILKQYIKR
jgi:hypothetical protein